MIEYHIHHHFEVRAVFADEINQRYAVKSSERMIAHGDKGYIANLLQHLFVIHPQCDVKLFQYSGCERYPGV